MKKIVGIVLALSLAASAMARGASGGSSDGRLVMGALIRNLNETFTRDYADNLQRLATQNNVELRLLDGNGDVATQLDQLNTLLSQGVMYFVIIPQDTSATEQMAQAIQNATNGRGAAAFSNIQPSVAALKVGPNFFLASSPETVCGNIQAEIADAYFTNHPDRLGPNKTINMVLIQGQLGHPAQVYRESGLLDELAARGYRVNIVARDTANWAAAEAQQKMDAWLAAYPGAFNIVFTQNDDMALGACESMLTNRYTDDPNDITRDVDGDGTVLRVPVIGVDATETGRRSMSEKKMYATVLQDSVGQSTTAFMLSYTVATQGAVNGAVINNIGPATAVTGEDPVTDPAVLRQCYLVPFVAVTEP